MRRRLRETLPMIRNELKPAIVTPQMAYVRWIQQQATQSRYYNRGAKQLQPLRVGDQVHFQTSYGPKPGSLLQSWKKEDTPMSYLVRSNGGAEYHRNRRFLINHPVDQCNNQIYPLFRNIMTVKEQSNASGRWAYTQRRYCSLNLYRNHG